MGRVRKFVSKMLAETLVRCALQKCHRIYEFIPLLALA